MGQTALCNTSTFGLTPFACSTNQAGKFNGPMYPHMWALEVVAKLTLCVTQEGANPATSL